MFEEQINNQQIYYQPIKWIAYDEFIEGIKKIIIVCKVLKFKMVNGDKFIQSNRTELLMFKDWKIPERISINFEEEIQNSNMYKGKFMRHILEKNGISNRTKCNLLNFYGYTDDKDRVYKIYFNSISKYWKFRNAKFPEYITYNGIKIYYTLNFNDSMINYITKFLKSKNLKYYSVFKISDIKDNFYIKTKFECNFISHENIEIVNKDIDNMIKLQSFNLKIISMDLETTSSTNRFPEKRNPDDKITQCSFIVRNYMSDKIVRNYLITQLPTHETHDKKYYELIIVKNEKELLITYYQMLKNEIPDFIIFHNGMGFDLPYLEARCRLYDINFRKIYKSIRSNYYNPRLINFGGKRNKIFYYDDLIIYMDTLAFAKYKFPNEPSYSLEALSQKYLGEGKDDVTAKEMWISFNKSLTLLKYYEFLENNPKIKISEQFAKELNITLKKVEKENKIIADYCVKDSLLPIRLLEKVKFLNELISVSQSNDVDMQTLIYNGEQIRTVNKLYRILDENINNNFQYYISQYSIQNFKDKFENMNYFGGYVIPPKPGFHNYLFCDDFNSMYPNKMRELNLCYTTFLCYEQYLDLLNNNKLTKNDVRIFEVYMKVFTMENLEGNYYIEEKGKGNEINKKYFRIDCDEYELVKYDNYDTRLKRLYQVESFDDDLLDKPVIRKRKSSGKTDFKYYYLKRYRPVFVKPHIREGVIPKILANLLNDRNKVKKFMKGLKEGSLEHDLNDGKQLGLKISMNSMYGFTGVPSGIAKAPLMLIGAVVTDQCQLSTLLGKKTSEKYFNSVVVYGDTDSVMIKPKQYFRLNNKIYFVVRNVEFDEEEVFKYLLSIYEEFKYYLIKNKKQYRFEDFETKYDVECNAKKLTRFINRLFQYLDMSNITESYKMKKIINIMKRQVAVISGSGATGMNYIFNYCFFTFDIFNYYREKIYTEVYTFPTKMVFEELSAMIISSIKKCYVKIYLYKEDNYKLQYDENGLVKFTRINKDGKEESIVKRRGTISVKRDRTKWEKITFDESIRYLCSGKPFKEYLNYYLKEIEKLFYEELNYKDFSFNNKVKDVSEYNPQTFMYYVVQGLIDRGFDVEQLISNRIDFICVRDPYATKKSEKVRMLNEMNGGNYEIDFQLTIERLEKQLNRFIEAIYKKEVSKFKDMLLDLPISNFIGSIFDNLYKWYNFEAIYDIIYKDYLKQCKGKDKYLELRKYKYLKIDKYIKMHLNPYRRFFNDNILTTLHKILISYYRHKHLEEDINIPNEKLANLIYTIFK
uniref:DNA polymerase n=1 Tax=Pithovirus LCDPAC02 TaxID=2506601 RepID=A0A481YQE5_9VIRU|nr:MAG: DNA polymerase elongation subunit family B [Pithovirus LCDPAC02]